VPEDSVKKLVDKLDSQKNISIDYRLMSESTHYFNSEEEASTIKDHTIDYLTRRIVELAAE